MANDRRMTTDRFFGGVGERLENLQALFKFVDTTEPDKAELQDWLESNTAAKSESTIKAYVGFQRSVGLLELEKDQYQTTPRGATFADTGDPELIFEALLENVDGFETILQTLDNEQTTTTAIQASLREAYPEYQLPQAVVGRHLEWLQAIDAIEKQQSADRYELTSFGKRLLQEKLDQKPTIDDLEIGSTYDRVELHEAYGGARYRGIAPSADYPYVFLFTGDSGTEHGYKDEFRGDTFIYTGEGRTGDMEMTGGNKAIRDHKEDSCELHLFENNDEAWSVTYLGQFECVDWFEEQLPDTDGDHRKAIRFKLEPVANEVEFTDPDLGAVDTDELYERATGAARTDDEATQQTTVETTRTIYSRSEAVREYALRVADGVCQGCGDEAPFLGNDGEPYFEVHHLYRRSDGGPDHPDNVIALCPNCHRRVHHGKDGDAFNQELISRAENVESDSGK
ncbi:HNH endonuclease signature motif containing protein [Haloterrigena salifodinae]|uniref:HNH endonuclease signature motif containing protein n=1 Tax=Haloterrigena salifodinae TaxID=2675099 RepID=UPI002013203C|nr:HNH endonuclease signature motif containing protein [Haloterrigena salifodinae]